jgi:hypothetical protein
MTSRHQQAFEQFHRENPQVYEHLERLAFKLRNRGVSRWGIKSLWETLRYEMAIATSSPVDDYRLNNNYTAYYARRLMDNNPDDLSGFFEIRQRRAGGSD